jgi:acetolactate synthase I/III small subunit
MPTFLLHARRTPEVLGRVVSLFHRRAIEIERLTAEPANYANILRVTIGLQVDSEQTQRIEANLYKLIDVLLLENADGTPRNEAHATRPPRG